MHPVLAYHERTKHSYASVRTGGRRLDWANEPSKFKRYRGGEPVRMPPWQATDVDAFEAIERSGRGEGREEVGIKELSHLLFHAAGVVRTARGPMGAFHFRTYASAGALYPNEVYVAAGEVEGLDRGLFHYGPEDHELRRLRAGDVRGSLGLAGTRPGAATVLITGIPWRTAWKYTTRGFRHLYWDAGMIVANLLAAAAATGVRARVVLGFMDDRLDHALGVDGTTEFALCAVTLGDGGMPDAVELPPLRIEAAPLSPRPRRDPAIEEARAAVALSEEGEVVRFREGWGQARGGPTIPAGEPLEGDAFEEVVRRRGSSRRLTPTPVPASEFEGILAHARGGLPADWPGGVVRPFLVANALEGFPQGAYAANGDLRLLREGDFREQAGYLCLEQRLGSDAAATTFLMAELGPIVAAAGGRGYAAAQLEAGIMAGRMYLGAYARCLGASGITFYDDEVRSFFATEAEPMLAVVLGRRGAAGPSVVAGSW